MSFVRIMLLSAVVTAMLGGVASAEIGYESPLKEKCNEEILKDAQWYRELGHLFADQLFFDPRTGAVAKPEVKLPEHEPGYSSPMRAECTAELKKDATWMAELRAHYDGKLSFDFQNRNSKTFTTNKQHVIGAYAALLILLVGFVVVMYMRQRKLVAEIERLREDVERAASE